MRTPFSKQTKWIGAAMFALAIVGFLALLSGSLAYRPTSRDASVTFLGYTNVTGKGRCVIFSITNTSRPRIALLLDSFEEDLAGSWTRRPLTLPSGMHITPEAHAWMSSFVGWKENLASGDGFIFHVAAPTTNAPWRIRFIAQQRDGWDRWRGMVGMTRPNSIVLFDKPSDPNRRFFGHRVFSGRRYTFLSPEVPQ
jgi:hypothetical protein